MSTFRFIHTGDWHIGRVFSMFPDDMARNLAHARITVIDRVADAARAFGASDILVAGDTYDAPDLPDRELIAPLKRLAANKEFTWHIIPGNHDPLENGGVWARVLSSGLPPNVKLHTEAAPVEIASRVWLLPCPLGVSVSGSKDPTSWMTTAATPDGALRIGLAHGSTSDFGVDDQGPVIAPLRADEASLSYLALGDWHGELRVADRAFYAGTPEPEQFKTNDAGFVRAVSLTGSRMETRSIPTARHRWLTLDVQSNPREALDDLIVLIDGLGSAAPEAIVRVQFNLVGDPAEFRDLNGRKSEIESRVRHLLWDETGLQLSTNDASLAELLNSRQLTEIATRLAERAKGQSKDAEISGRALRLLLTYASGAATPSRSRGV